MMALTSRVQKTKWVVDTGATDHACNNPELFESLQLDNNGLQPVLTAAGNVMPKGIGTVKINVHLPNGQRELVLQKVLYMPDFPVNLFSALKLFVKSGSICPKSKTLKDSKGESIASVDISPDGLELRVIGPGASLPTALVVSRKPRALPIRLWHLRLGHRSLDDVRQTAKSATGIVLEDPEPEKDTASTICGSCEAGKSEQQLSRAKRDEPQGVLDEISVDVLGPTTPVGFNGHKWATIITCRKSRARWIYTHKEKAEAQRIVRDFIEMAWVQYGVRIKFLDLDGGKEFGVGSLKDLSKKKGFIVRITTPYSSYMNGMSERGIQLVTKCLRCAFIHSDMPRNLWPELIVAQVHTTNRTATSALSGMTPYEEFCKGIAANQSPGSKEEDPDLYRPDVSHLRVLGSKVWVHIHKERRVVGAKFEPRGEVGVLVGYEGNRIYRVRVPDRRDIVRTASIRFDENSDEHVLDADPYGELDIPDHLNDTPNQTANFNPNPQNTGQEVQSPRALPNSPTTEVDPELDDPDSTIIVQMPEGSTSGEPRASKRGPGRPPKSSTRPLDTSLPPSEGRIMTRNQKGQSTVATDVTRSQTGQSTRTADNTHQAQAFVSMLLKHPDEPGTYEEAQDSPHSREWESAMQQELKTLEENNTWTIVEPPKGAQVLKSRWVYKIKEPLNAPVKYKARFVVKGYNQNVELEQTFAGVVRASTVKILWAMAASLDWEVEQMDAVSAFTQGEIGDPVYVEMPQGFHELKGSHQDSSRKVLLLKKALYGLKTSALIWQKKCRKDLAELGFCPLLSDDCAYLNQESGIVIVTYVDDFLIFGKDLVHIRGLKQALQERMRIEDLGPCHKFCGTRVIRDRPNRSIHLVQDQYISRVIHAFGMEDCKPVSTPMEAGAAIHMVPSIEDPEDKRTARYQSIIGSAIFANTQTRPDISYACSTLSRFNHNPSPAHLRAAERVIRYFQGTRLLGITYEGKAQGTLDINAYSDSDYAGDLDTRRSTTGYLVYMAGSPVVWKAQRQKAVTLSSTEAEYYALTAVAKELAWMQHFLSEVGYNGPDLHPMTIHGDNQGSLSLAENPQYHQKTKHIEVQYHYIRQEVKAGNVVLNYLPTERMPADGLTKPLNLIRYSEFLKLLNMQQWIGKDN